MSKSHGAMSNTITSAANLSNLLPTGTVLAFQLLTPVFTSNGVCEHATRSLTALFLFLLAAFCFLTSFTDSVKAEDGNTYFGFVTSKGMSIIDYPDPNMKGLPDLTVYKMRAGDWVHATLSVLVFAAIALRDKYVTSCFYPALEEDTRRVLDTVPMAVGIFCSLLFTHFPTRRHGIGYLVTGNVDRRP